MSTETDVHLTFELEEKVTKRIKSTMLDALAMGPQGDRGIQGATAQALKYELLNDSYFIAEMTKRIGQRMGNSY